MDSPLYEQQGKPLDVALGVNGEWVIYEYLFLFRPPPDQKFTQVKLSSGKNCHGFNVVLLAEAFTAAGPLAMDASTLLLNNRIGSLSVTERPGIITPPATYAVDIIFGLPYGAQVLCPIKSAPIAGHA